MMHLIQRRMYDALIEVEPPTCDHGRRKNDALNHCATPQINLFQRLVAEFKKRYI